MATCRKCVHFADCLNIGKTRYYGKESACNNVEELCKFFKSQDNFVEVVRCKNCKYWDEDERCNGIQNGLTLEYTNGYDYCSYGERKDGAEE